jgi:predicted nucleic acid-binding protein
MKARLYMETSVVSYLTARPALEPVMAGRQLSTLDWWKKQRAKFEIFISRLVWQEASEGDAEAVKRRLRVLKPLRWLQVRKDVIALAKRLSGKRLLPPNAADDALHIALAAAHGMDFLLTWNFTHINNAATEEAVRNVCESHGFQCPVICTPDELMQI